MNRTTLNKATSPDPSPTPGYLFDEIAKVTHDPLGNDRLVQYLVKRLESPSADVKAKVLNIIKHVCRKGNPSFRRSWQREAGTIKAHLQYHTAPDPLRGDEPSKRVRENAKEALEAVFDASRDEKKANPALAGRIQGFGGAPPPPPQAEYHQPSAASSTPTAYAQPSSSSAYASAQPSKYSGSRYEGIGNPNFQDPRNQPKGILERVVDVVREKVEKQAESIPGVGGVKPAWMNQNTAALPSGYGFASNRGGGEYSASSGSYDPTAAQRQGVDPVWSDPRSPRPVFGVSGTVISAPVQAQPSSSNGAQARQQRATERSDGSYEKNVVDELCAPGGVRPVPPKDKLDSFCKACRTLDPNWIISFLDEKMAEDDWKIQHKALCVVEALLQTPGLEAFADRLDQTPDNLEALYTSKNPSVRERAQKVWKLLYDDEGNGNNSNGGDGYTDMNEPQLLTPESSPPKRSTGGPETNLLDFGEAFAAPTASSSSISHFATQTPMIQPTQANSGTASISAMPNMFQNLSVKGPTSSTSTVSAVAVAKPQVASAGASSSFSFMSSPNVAQRPPPNTGASLMDFQVVQPTSRRPVSSQAPSMDFFSLPVNVSPSASVPLVGSLPPSFGSVPLQLPKATPSVKQPVSGQLAPAKKMDSFNFVQEALQESRKA
jgi:hypothetical protein